MLVKYLGFTLFAFALLSTGCGDVKPDTAAVDASSIDANTFDGGVGVPDATLPTCTDGVQNGDEEAVDCGGSTCDECVDCTLPGDCESGECRDGTCAVTRMEACTDAAPGNATATSADVLTTYTAGSGWSTPANCAWTCNTDYDESTGTCINQQTVSCTDTAPANGTSTTADVTVTYTTAGGWTAPAACAWACNADYEESTGSCINQKMAACADNAPVNAASVVSDVTITYTDAGGWTSPAGCAWTCNTDYDESTGTCINQKPIACQDAAPANGSSSVADVTVTYTTAGGWTTPADCAWSCNGDYFETGGMCINQRSASCTDAAPANGTSTVANVTVTYTDAGGWSTPADCAWTCDANHDQFGATCINQQLVSCTDAAPANATSTAGLVTIAYTDASGWTTPAACSWFCDANYDQSGNSCINQQLVSCNDAAPANATSANGNVTISYSDAGGWTDPADCAWTCNTNYDQSGNSCINQRSVQCNDAAPANATSTTANVTITYTTAGGWTSPADCAWTCDGDYCLNGGVCDPPSYLEQKFESAASNSTFFGGGTPSNPRNLGVGQRLTPTADLTMAEFAFNYTGAFRNEVNTPVKVTLQLNVWDVNGKALATTQTTVPASFTGGWVWFNMPGNLKKGTVYYFTSFLVGGYQSGVDTGIKADAAGDYTGGYRTVAEDRTGTTNLGTFGPWSTGQGTWDMFFWARSAPFCPAN